jgi:adenylyltransferase/sulfurtransferase
MISNGEIDYAEFCGVVNYDVLKSEERINITEYNEVVTNGQEHVLLDVRPVEHYEIVHLPKSINIPLDTLKRVEDVEDLKFDVTKPIYTICRYGNDSQYASRYLNDTFGLETKDISGGLFQWSEKIDNDLPTY